jgi:hypothetical protein
MAVIVVRSEVVNYSQVVHLIDQLLDSVLGQVRQSLMFCSS